MFVHVKLVILAKLVFQMYLIMMKPFSVDGVVRRALGGMNFGDCSFVESVFEFQLDFLDRSVVLKHKCASQMGSAWGCPQSWVSA